MCRCCGHRVCVLCVLCGWCVERRGRREHAERGSDLGVHGLFDAARGFFNNFGDKIHLKGEGGHLVLEDEEFFVVEGFAFEGLFHQRVDIVFAVVESVKKAFDAFCGAGFLGCVGSLCFLRLCDLADRACFFNLLCLVHLVDLLWLVGLLGLHALLELGCIPALVADLLARLRVLHLLHLLHCDLCSAATCSGQWIAHGILLCSRCVFG